MNLKLFIAVCMIGLLAAGCAKKKTTVAQVREVTYFEAAVDEAIDRQLHDYPESTVKDFYKSFFQDKFGPGHIISDTAAAGAYIRSEMASYSEIEGMEAEPVGWMGNFYRVNLSVLKSGRVPYEVYLNAFFRSAQDIAMPSLDEWKDEWKQIEALILARNLSLPDCEADIAEIEQNLAKGVYMGHHSSRYEELYQPHYRLISKKEYEQNIKPLLIAE